MGKGPGAVVSSCMLGEGASLELLDAHLAVAIGVELAKEVNDALELRHERLPERFHRRRRHVTCRRRLRRDRIGG